MSIDLDRIAALLDRLDPHLDSVCRIPGCTHVDVFGETADDGPPIRLAA